MFNKRTQETGESVDHFKTDVIKLAEHCQYGDLKDDLIRDKLVSGIQDDKVREKLLGIKNLTLEAAIEMLRTTQAIKCRLKDMGGLTTQETLERNSSVNVVKHKKKVEREGRDQHKISKGMRNQARTNTPAVRKVCKFCGKQHEFKRELCPASGKKCKKCGKQGHFQKVCQSANAVHAVEDSQSEEETFAISTVKRSSSTPTLITFKVNQHHNITFEIDTGASCNILPFTEYVKATGDDRGCEIKKTATRLTMHNDTSERPMG